MTGRQPGHDGGGLGHSPIKPSAKRALFVGLRGLNANITARAAGLFQPVACTLLRGSGRAAQGLFPALCGTGAGREPGDQREPGGCGGFAVAEAG